MHIPDGYLSPRTCVLFYAVMSPIWFFSSRKVEKTLRLKELPLLALGAAFTFVIMMFNIPIPGGSSGHMVGGALVAIVLGPWAGVVALSITLGLQALIFNDGGLTAFGANCFNMAFIMSFAGYYIHRVLASGEPGALRRWVAVFIAAYLAVNIAALAVAFELGAQPLMAHASDGRPLYAPYPLSITVPAMLVPHLLFFGPIEGLGAALAVSYIYRVDRNLLHGRENALRPVWAVLIILILLTPLGLLASGSPWGEWGKTEIIRLVGYVPQGMERLGGGWHGVMPGYGVPGVTGLRSAVYYMLSAALGSAVVLLIIFVWGKLWPR